jgi:hypothetical protein
VSSLTDVAVVMAQLYTPDGKNGALVRRGPFPFIVPVRDRKTRELLPGRIVQDLGPKAGCALLSFSLVAPSLAFLVVIRPFLPLRPHADLLHLFKTL